LRAIESQNGVAAVDRALTILAALETAAEPSTLAELTRATQFCKSTILRLINSLENAGYIIRLGDGCYSLGPSGTVSPISGRTRFGSTHCRSCRSLSQTEQRVRHCMWSFTTDRATG
jgi:predicted DNA-binding transcriptional regulator YafY